MTITTSKNCRDDFTTRTVVDSGVTFRVESYNVNGQLSHHELNIEQTDESILKFQINEHINMFHVLDADVDVDQVIERMIKKIKVIRIMTSFTQEMENYGYVGSNPGISESNYEDVADKILNEI